MTDTTSQILALSALEAAQAQATGIAGKVFIAADERMRTFQNGNPEPSFEDIEFSETFSEYYERKQREGGA